jgi:hypothetical protein
VQSAVLRTEGEERIVINKQRDDHGAGAIDMLVSAA